MTGKSEFELKCGRYILRNDKLVVFLLNENYGQQLLEKVREFEQKSDGSHAEALLLKVAEGSFLSEVRKAHNLDVIKLAAALKKEEELKIRGDRYRCSCSTIFYDLEREDARCPKCGKAKAECTRAG